MGIYTDTRKTTRTPDGYELLMHESGHLEYNFDWHMGPYWSKYLAEQRDNKRFMATKCSECGTVYCPPRKVCARCYVEMNEWVEVGPEGTLQGFTIVRFPYIDPNVGTLMKVPFTAIWITLDGTDTRMMHFCNKLDEKDLEVGMRMRAVWEDEPRPTSIHAVKYFETLDEPRAKAVKKPAAKKKPTAKKRAAKKAPAKKKPAAKKPAAKKAPAKKKAAAKKKPATKKAAAKKKPAAKRPAAKKAPAKKKTAARKPAVKKAPARKAAAKKKPARKK